MEPHLQKTVDDLLGRLKELEKEAGETKRMINGLCALAKVPPMFPVVEPESIGITSIKGDTFYGQPFATAATTYLRMRKAMNMGPASVAEIYEALKSGGYQFDATNEDYAKRGVRHSLTKNTQTFHKVPNGDFGLMDWYPAVKKTKSSKNGSVGDRAGNGPNGDDDQHEDDERDTNERAEDTEFGGDPDDFGSFGGPPEPSEAKSPTSANGAPESAVKPTQVAAPESVAKPAPKPKTTRKTSAE